MKAFLLLIATLSFAMSSPIPDFPFLFVSGHAFEDVPTARAKITFSLENENEQSEVGEAELQKASIAIMALLKENGVKDAEVNASEVHKSRVSKDPFEEAKKQIYFQFRQEFEVTIHDLALYPKLAEKFIGSDKVSNFDSYFYAGEMAEVTKRLRIAALKNARENAQTLAQASGVELGVVHSFSEHNFSALGELIGEESYDPPNLPPGRNEVYQVPKTVRESFSVQVLYRLAEPENKSGNHKSGQSPARPDSK